MSNIVFNNERPKTVKPDAVDKAIALIFLKQALVDEEYEGCARLVNKAKCCGARTREINRILSTVTPRVKGRL